MMMRLCRERIGLLSGSFPYVTGSVIHLVRELLAKSQLYQFAYGIQTGFHALVLTARRLATFFRLLAKQSLLYRS